GAVPDDGVEPEDGEVERGGAVHGGAGGGHLFEQKRRLGDAQAAAAVLGRDEDAKPAGGGEGTVEVPGELVRLVALAPVGVAELRSEVARLGADQLLGF